MAEELTIPTWALWKSTVLTTRPLPVCFVDFGDAYKVWAVGPGVNFAIVVPKLLPDGNANPDATDFDSNIKPTANLQQGDIVIAGDIPFPAESTATTAPFTNMRPVNGDFRVGRMKTKQIYIENLGAGNAMVQVLGNFSNAGGGENTIVIVAPQAHNAGQGLSVEADAPFQSIQVLARIAALSTPTTIRTRGYALGT